MTIANVVANYQKKLGIRLNSLFLQMMSLINIEEINKKLGNPIKFPLPPSLSNSCQLSKTHTIAAYCQTNVDEKQQLPSIVEATTVRSSRLLPTPTPKQQLFIHLDYSSRLFGCYFCWFCKSSCQVSSPTNCNEQTSFQTIQVKIPLAIFVY